MSDLFHYVNIGIGGERVKKVENFFPFLNLWTAKAIISFVSELKSTKRRADALINIVTNRNLMSRTAVSKLLNNDISL